MGKIFLFVIVLLGAGLYFEETREVIVDVVEPATHPWHRWMTGQELSRIVTDLEAHERSEGTLPTRPDEFQDWLEERYPQESSRVDGWGNAYHLEVAGSTFQVISPGPDGELGTEDDLVREGERSGGGAFR